MRNIKLFEDYHNDLEELQKKKEDIKNNIVNDITSWMKKEKLNEFLFIYRDDKTDKCPYTKDIDINFDEIWVEDTEIIDRDYSFGIVRKIFFESDLLRVYCEFPNGDDKITLDYLKVSETLDILDYLYSCTDEMIEQQRINQESEKFNM